MNKLNRVTAIVPCYNREKYIFATILSVLDQTFKDIDVVVVDDGCTDGSRKVLEQFSDRIRLLEHPGRANRGQSASINLGLANSSGEFVAILDSDDLWAPTKIAEQVSHLDCHADAGMVYGNGHAIDGDGRELYRIYDDAHRELNQPSRLLEDCYLLIPSNSLVRRSVFDAAGRFDETLRSGQDHDMAIRIAEVTKLAYVNATWFYYRRHGDSISAKRADLRWRTGFKILAKAKERYPYSRRTVRRRLGVLHFRLGQTLLEDGRLVTGAYHLVLALFCDPVRALGVLAGREPVDSPH